MMLLATQSMHQKNQIPVRPKPRCFTEIHPPRTRISHILRTDIMVTYNESPVLLRHAGSIKAVGQVKGMKKRTS
jgi:hypothetical protein